MLQDLLELECQMPAWLRPTYRGALFIFGMSVGWAGKLFTLSILATLTLLAGVEGGVLLFLGSLAVAMGAGAAAGTVHGILYPLERLGQLGTWLRWAGSSFACLVAIPVLAPKGPLSLDPTFFSLAAAVSALSAGCLILLDDRRPTRPSFRRFQSRQRRARLFAAARGARARLQKGAAPCPSHSIS